MRRFENDCVRCDIPCTHCGLEKVEHIYCDTCGVDIGTTVHLGGKVCSDAITIDGVDYCPDCLMDLLCRLLDKESYLDYLKKNNDIEAYDEILEGYEDYQVYMSEEDPFDLFYYAKKESLI